MEPTPSGGPRVLVIGLDPFRVPGPWDPQPVQDAIEAGMAELARRGLDAESCLVGLGPDDDVEGSVTTAVRGRPWDCVVIGGGLRKEEDLLPVFESILNLVHRHAPAASIALNSGLNDVPEAVARHLPVDGRGDELTTT